MFTGSEAGLTLIERSRALYLGPVVTGGGGLDWYFGCHFGVRLLEADDEFIHVDSGVSHGALSAGTFVWGDNENINAIRVAAGLVLRSASAWSPVYGCGPAPVSLACTASNGAIFPGEPVTLTAVASGLNPKRNATYIWTGAGVVANEDTATVPTAALAPGTYTVRARVTEGVKAGQSAECEASFTVKPYLPPTLACAAGPLVIHPDQTSSVTLTAISPQNRPLSYACTSSAGTVTVNGDVATFSPSPGKSGSALINCTATDDKGQIATCGTEVTILKPPVILPRVKPLCPIDFSSDSQRPTRVDNEAKACLDDIAIALQQDPDATLVVVGEASSGEPQGSAAQRAVNTKEYLAKEKGIDPARITVVTGTEGTQTVQPYLAPAGSSFTSAVHGTTPVDESVVKPVVRKPLPARSKPQKPAPAAKSAKPANVKKKQNKPASSTEQQRKPVDGP